MKLIGFGVATLGVIAVGVYFSNKGGDQAGQVVPDGGLGGGFDVSKVECEGIDAARDAVNKELNDRKDAAAKTLGAAMEAASDAYHETWRTIDTTRQQCESEALLADPCKELFERSSRLADEILKNIDNGFDEAKFQEREGVKKEYDECLKNPPKEDTYPGKLEQCQKAFNEANEKALATRKASEELAQSQHDTTVSSATAQHTSKMAALDALEKECEDTKYERLYGNLPSTGIPITDYQGGSPACTGLFPGKDPELQRQISSLRSQLDKAKAGGNTTGFMGTIQLQERINELEAEMASGDAKCTTDADCGGPEPVCCNIGEIGRAICSDGVCTNEKTACRAEEVCGGQPAQCIGLIEVIEYQGSYIPRDQLRIGEVHEPDESGGCPDRHWHADVTVIATDGKEFTDPAPHACGFGELTKKPVVKIRGN